MYICNIIKIKKMEEIEKEIFIRKIKDEMYAQRVTTSNLAKNINENKVTIWRFLYKDTNINWFTFVKIIKFLNLKID